MQIKLLEILDNSAFNFYLQPHLQIKAVTKMGKWGKKRQTTDDR
jgi:hypothetical protein